jgi:hypothetical protein
MRRFIIPERAGPVQATSERPGVRAVSNMRFIVNPPATLDTVARVEITEPATAAGPEQVKVVTPGRPKK